MKVMKRDFFEIDKKLANWYPNDFFDNENDQEYSDCNDYFMIEKHYSGDTVAYTVEFSTCSGGAYSMIFSTDGHASKEEQEKCKQARDVEGYYSYRDATRKKERIRYYNAEKEKVSSRYRALKTEKGERNFKMSDFIDALCATKSGKKYWYF